MRANREKYACQEKKMTGFHAGLTNLLLTTTISRHLSMFAAKLLDFRAPTLPLSTYVCSHYFIEHLLLFPIFH